MNDCVENIINDDEVIIWVNKRLRIWSIGKFKVDKLVLRVAYYFELRHNVVSKYLFC